MEDLVKIKNAIPERIEPTNLYLTEIERENIAKALISKGIGDVKSLLDKINSSTREEYLK